MRTLKAYAQAVGTQIGVGLGSALRHVIILLNTMMKYVLKAATAFATFMQTIFGKYKGGASGIAMDGFGDAVDYAEDLGDAAGDAASGLGSAADSAKQLKKDLSVLPFDELNQLNKDRDETSSGGGSGGSGGSGGAGGISDGLLDWGDFGDTPLGKLPDEISAWAQQIKAAFTGHDWNLLGQLVATGLNKGIQKVYDLLDPQKIREKVDPWIEAFATSFNSFVKWFDFDLLGRTVGRGINDVVHILNKSIESIEWWNLGNQIANGVNGLFDEVDWVGLGNLVGNKFMILWNTLNGFVHGFDWAGLGTSVADLFNGVFDKVDFSTIADTISTGLNGVFTSLATFTAGFDWTSLVHKLAKGINTFIRNFDWKGNGEKLGDFLKHLCDALIELVDTVNWEELGQGIADFLQELPWKDMLWAAAHALITAFGGLLEGLASTPAGKFAAAFLIGIAVFKVGSRIVPFITKIGSAISGESSSTLISTAIEKLLKGGIKTGSSADTVTSTATAAGTSLATKFKSGLLKMVDGVKNVFASIGQLFKTGFTSLAEAAKSAGESVATKFAGSFSSFLSSGVGVAILETGAIGATLVVAKKFSESWDKARGGNGLLTDFGTGIQDYIDKMATANALNHEQQQALFDLKERYEDTGATASEAVQGIIDEMVNLGVPMGTATELAWQMVGAGEGQEEVMQMIAAAAQQASDKIGEYNGALGQTNKTVGEARNDFYGAIQDLINMKNAAGESSSEYQGLLESFGMTMGSATTAGEAYQMIIDYLNDAGIDASEFNKIISEEYGYAISDASGHTATAKKNWSELGSIAKASASDIQTSVEGIKGKFTEMQENAREKVDSMKSKVQEMVEKWRSAGSATTEYANTTKTNMNDTATSVSDFKSTADSNLDENEKKFGSWQSLSIGHMVSMIAKMGIVAQGAQNMAEVSSEYATKMEGNFKASFSAISEAAKNMASEFTTALTALENDLSATMANIHNIMAIDLTMDGYNAAQSFANGFQSVHIPTPYMYVSGYNYVSLGRGGGFSIPYFSVGWYRRGGLFLGGDGQMIGVAEDGRDEAVLPLEDRRAMARIGSAIAEAGGTQSQDQTIDKIAERLADIIMMRQENEPNPIIHVEVKTENDEVLARAVTRGQQKLDYRNNPTPKLAY